MENRVTNQFLYQKRKNLNENSNLLNIYTMAKLDLKFARIKANSTEEKALEQVCTANNVQPQQLVANHTEKMWYWEINPKVFVFEIKDENSLEEAIATAADHFATIQQNIKYEQTETHFILSRIRG